MSRGFIIPFRRDRKRDFASGSGADLLRSKVEQALMTQGKTPRSAGELLWRTELGSGLHLLRHQKNSAALEELARVYVRDALRRWVPEVEVVGMDVVHDGSALRCRIQCSLRSTQNDATLVEVTALDVPLE
jgi:phage gp46-like protein